VEQTRASGKLMLQRDASQYEAAKKALWRMLAALFSEGDAAAEPAAVPISRQIAQGVSALVKRYGDDPKTRRLLKQSMKEALDSL
jgi:hypothetical protein